MEKKKAKIEYINCNRFKLLRFNTSWRIILYNMNVVFFLYHVQMINIINVINYVCIYI